MANIPVNQQDALPLFPLGAGPGGPSPGTVTVIGGAVNKKWTAAQTGINGSPTTTDANGHVFCVTNFLDLSGCRTFSFLMLRTSNAGALGATPNMTLYYQFRVDAADVAPTSYNAVSINLPFCGMSQILNAGFVWPGLGVGETQRATESGDHSEVTGFAGVVGPMGFDVRFFMSWSTNPVDADNRFSMVAWAGS